MKLTQHVGTRDGKLVRLPVKKKKSKSEIIDDKLKKAAKKIDASL
jgi:hypothetical protein